MFLAALAAPVFAASQESPLDFITKMASALSEGNGLAFLDRVDHRMPDYQTLERNILALTAQNEVLSSVERLKDEGDENTRNLELDWFLQIRSRETNGGIERRRQTVKCGIERQKKKWKVMSLAPVSLFAPPVPR